MKPGKRTAAAATPHQGRDLPATRSGMQTPGGDGPGASVVQQLLAMQRSAGNAAVRQVVVQRRAGKVPARSVLNADGPVTVPFGGDDAYDAALDAVDLYHNATKVPESDHGKQLYVLTSTLPDKIKAWEGAGNGPVSNPVTPGLLGLSRADKRRVVLKKLQDAVALEDPLVRDQGFVAATAAHQADRAKLIEYLDAGLTSSDRRLKNSCEWIKTAGKAKLYALTPTGDSYARLIKGGKNPAKDEAWFPRGRAGAPGDIVGAAVSYVKGDLADNTNVVLDDDGKVTGGWNTPGLIAITNPAKATKETVWETLRHEVQHDADKNKGRDAQAGVRRAAEAVDAAVGVSAKAAAEAMLDAEYSLQRYKTEYRAYNYQEGSMPGPYAALDNTAQNKTHEGKQFSERQLTIFRHIYGGYAYTKKHWDLNSPLSDGTTFKDAVAAYWDPDTEGMNKYNSPRVDDFWMKLDAVGTKKAATTKAAPGGVDARPVDAKVSDVTDPAVVALLKAVDDLDGDDADAIANESPAMRRKIEAHLDGAAKTEVLDKLSLMAAFSKLTSLFDGL